MTFKFENLEDFQVGRGDQAFKWSLAPMVLATLIFSALALLGVWQSISPSSQFVDVPGFARAIFTGGFLICAWMAWLQAKAGIGANALVFVLADRLLWVKYRSPLNAQVGNKQDLQLVGIPLEAIQWSKRRSVKTIRNDSGGKPRTKVVDCLDLGLGESLEMGPLNERLQQERELRKKASSLHHHYPLKPLKGKTIRLDFYNVSGGSKALQAALPSSIATHEDEAEVIDLR